MRRAVREPRVRALPAWPRPLGRRRASAASAAPIRRIRRRAASPPAAARGRRARRAPNLTRPAIFF